jgi:hypothetical protein
MLEYLVPDRVDEHTAWFQCRNVAAGWPSPGHWGLGYSVDYPGYSTPVAGAELYDPRLGTWMPTAAMSTPRSQHAVALLRDGRVLVSGGMRASSILASAEIYNPALGTWSMTGSMGVSRYYHTATLLPDGRVLVIGGIPSALGSAEIYDPALGTWSPIPSMSHRGRDIQGECEGRSTLCLQRWWLWDDVVCRAGGERGSRHHVGDGDQDVRGDRANDAVGNSTTRSVTYTVTSGKR